MVVVDIDIVIVVQSPPSKLQSSLFDSLLQTPFPTNSVWGQPLYENKNIQNQQGHPSKDLSSHSISILFSL